MIAHTPAPWRMGKQGTGSRVILAAGREVGCVWCQTQWGDRPDDSPRAMAMDEATANARLMVAAPGLLSITKLLIEQVDSFGGTFFPQEINGTIKALRDRVADAEGRS